MSDVILSMIKTRTIDEAPYFVLISLHKSYIPNMSECYCYIPLLDKRYRVESHVNSTFTHQPSPIVQIIATSPNPERLTTENKAFTPYPGFSCRPDMDFVCHVWLKKSMVCLLDL